MKPLFLLFVLFLPLNAIIAQSVTVGTISKTTLCSGDTVWVPYSSNGSFAADNFFATQLSDANGSFAAFKNIGHDISGVDSIPIFIDGVGAHFRVRVIASDPYTISINTSSDISIINYPSPKPAPVTYATSFGYVAFMGDVVQFTDAALEPSGSKYLWSFGQDASIFVSIDSSPKVIYPSVGIKSGSLTVSNKAGCSTTIPFQFIILSCRPVIPESAHIVTGTESGSFLNVWVKAGGNYTVNEAPITQIRNTTVFAEPGASVYTNQGSTGSYYLKPGSSFTWNEASEALVILTKGSFISYTDLLHQVDTIYCDDLQFDYSQVGGSDVRIEENPMQIMNTLNGLRASCEGEVISASVVNILGAKVFSKTDRDLLSLDLSALADGVYFATITSGNHLEFRKIAVVH